MYFTAGKDSFKLNVIGKDARNWKGYTASSRRSGHEWFFLAAMLVQEIGCTDAFIYTIDSDVAILAMY